MQFVYYAAVIGIVKCFTYSLLGSHPLTGCTHELTTFHCDRDTLLWSIYHTIIPQCTQFSIVHSDLTDGSPIRLYTRFTATRLYIEQTQGIEFTG